MTSHDCVAKVRRLLKTKRVGHGGTLDPMATGVLPIAIGRATRLLQFLPSDKAYRATIRFGLRTTTDDLEGDILTQQPARSLSLDAIAPHLSQMQGTIQQVPPSYSAVQVQGKRLYELARSGQVVEAPTRTVQVYQIEVLDWREGDYPELDVTIACGSGTYIRSIARDLGDVVDTGATLATLLRTKSSGLSLNDSVTFETMQQQLETESFELLSPAIALQHLPEYQLSPTREKLWRNGRALLVKAEQVGHEPKGDVLRLHAQNGEFLGIGQYVQDDGKSKIIPKVVFLPA